MHSFTHTQMGSIAVADVLKECSKTCDRFTFGLPSKVHFFIPSYHVQGIFENDLSIFGLSCYARITDIFDQCDKLLQGIRPLGISPMHIICIH